MNNKKLLPITLLTTFFLAACTNAGGSGNKPIVLPEEHEDGHHTFTINNLTELQSGWPAAAKGEAGLQKTFDISVFTDSVEGNAEVEMNNKNLELISSDPKVLSVSGFTATSGVVGEATIAVRFYETVKHFKFTVSELLPEPAVVTGKTLAQINADAADAKNTKLYEASGKVKGWKTKDSWNEFGEFELEDESGTLYVYGSYVNTTAQPAKFEWDGSAGEYKNGGKVTSTDRNATTADMTKDLKIGDEVVITVCHAKSFENYYGIFKSVTAGEVVECTSVELDKDSLSLTEGLTETLTATILPENCNQAASWESSDPDVATVNGGKVVAVAEGTATITVTVGSKTDTCTVTVTKNESGYSLATMTGVEKASEVTVNGHAGLKIGNSSTAGIMTITVPSGATELVFYAGTWKGTSEAASKLAITQGETELDPVSVPSDEAFTGSATEFTVAEEDNFKVVLTLNNITEETVFTVTCGKRAVIWAAQYK